MGLKDATKCDGPIIGDRSAGAQSRSCGNESGLGKAIRGKMYFFSNHMVNVDSIRKRENYGMDVRIYKKTITFISFKHHINFNDGIRT